MAPAKKGG